MRIVILAAILCFFSGFRIANAEILFLDDFETDKIGEEPSKWEHLNFNSGNSKILIEKDPIDPQNKAAKPPGSGSSSQ